MVVYSAARSALGLNVNTTKLEFRGPMAVWENRSLNFWPIERTALSGHLKDLHSVKKTARRKSIYFQKKRSKDTYLSLGGVKYSFQKWLKKTTTWYCYLTLNFDVLQNRNRLTEIQNQLMITKGDHGDGGQWRDKLEVWD